MSALDELRIGDTSLYVDVINAVTSFTIDMSSSNMTEMALEFSDPDWVLMAANVFQRKQIITWRDLKCEIAVVEIGGNPSPQGVTIRCRSYAVQKFKRTKHAITRRNISPTDFLRLEAGLVGGTVIGQPSARKTQIARVNTEDKQQSSWDVMNELASELGYLFFECAGVFYFGQPSWLIQREAKWAFDYPSSDDPTGIVILDTPSCRSSEDSKDGASISMMVDRTTGVSVRPGDCATVTGIPQFSGTYMVDSVSWSPLSESEPVSISLVTPIDPEKKDDSKKKVYKEVIETDGPAALINREALLKWTTSA